MDTSDEVKFHLLLGEAVRARRLELGLTQQALASTTGVTRTSITNIEKGAQKLSAYRLFRVASALRTTPASLLPDAPVADRSMRDVDAAVADLKRDARHFVITTLTKVSKERDAEASV